MEIKRLGSYQGIDEQGYLLSLADASKIQSEWAEVLEMLKEAYLDKWGDAIHSIYVRGSVAKGGAVKGISDLDSFAVTTKGTKVSEMRKQDSYRKWEEKLEENIKSSYPYVPKIEMGLIDFEAATDWTSPYASTIKTESVCVYGKDIAERLPGYKIGPEIAFQTRYFRQHLDLFLEEYPDEPEDEKADFLNWMMRRFLRLGMELVMEREQKFTRDLYLCYESFSKHYPEKQDEMYRALELAINPVVNNETFEFVQKFGTWLASEAQRALTSYAR